MALGSARCSSLVSCPGCCRCHSRSARTIGSQVIDDENRQSVCNRNACCCMYEVQQYGQLPLIQGASYLVVAVGGVVWRLQFNVKMNDPSSLQILARC